MKDRGEQYSHRGAYGDPTPVCEWCGKRVQLPLPWREYGTYCSDECRAAARHDSFFAMFFITIIVAIVSLGGLILGNQFFLWTAILILNGFCLLYSGYMSNLGSKVLQAESLPSDMSELEDTCSKIQEIIASNQTTKGVSRKTIYSDMRSYGFSNRLIKFGIDNLLVTGKIREVGFAQYAIDE
jgi:hypothetical protein